MKALVTGGAGFIGSHLVELLVAEGHEVVVVDNLSSGKLSNLEDLEIEFHQVDIRDIENLFPLFQSVDWVFHLAGMADVVPSIANPRDYYDVNVTGTLNVLEASRTADIKKFIYASSASCYGDSSMIPTPEEAEIRCPHPYGLTKYMGEELVMHWGKEYGLSVNSLRLFNVYGPRARATGAYSSVFGIFLEQKKNGEPLTVVGDGNQTRDYVFVTDVARAFYLAAVGVHQGEVLNVGCGEEHSVNDIVSLLDTDYINLPKRSGEPERSCATIDKIRKLLGWKPTMSFAEGVKLLMNLMDSHEQAFPV